MSDPRPLPAAYIANIHNAAKRVLGSVERRRAWPESKWGSPVVLMHLCSEIARLQIALARYRYAVAFASADAWDGGPEIRERFEWARANDGAEQLTNNEIAVIGGQFHGVRESAVNPSKD